jgi:hypothetical protein
LLHAGERLDWNKEMCSGDLPSVFRLLF